MTATLQSRPVQVKGYSRSRPRKPDAFHRMCEELQNGIAIDRAMEEFAEEFPGDTWRDESSILTMGLPV